MGTIKLATEKELKIARKNRMDRRCDPRILNFQKWLSERAGLFDIVLWEDVMFASTTLQCQLWSSFRTCIWLVFGGRYDVILDCVPVGTLKKFATGHGNATKGMMAAAYQALGFSTFGLDDNAIDAFFLWKWGIEKFNL